MKAPSSASFVDQPAHIFAAVLQSLWPARAIPKHGSGAPRRIALLRLSAATWFAQAAALMHAAIKIPRCKLDTAIPYRPGG